MCELCLSHICFVTNTSSQESHWRVFKAKKKRPSQVSATHKDTRGIFFSYHTQCGSLQRWQYLLMMSCAGNVSFCDLILNLALWRGRREDVTQWNNTYQIRPFCLFSRLLKVENKTALVKGPLAPSGDKSNKPASAHLNKSLSTYLRIHHVQWVELILALDKVTTGLFCLLALVNRTVDTKSEPQTFAECVTFCHSPSVSALVQVWTIALPKEVKNGSGELFFFFLNDDSKRT